MHNFVRSLNVILITLFVLLTVYLDPCNENQLGALFIHSLFRQSTSTCFVHICSPSSGCILLFSWLSVGRANIQSTEKHNTHQLYIYSIPPDEGLQICPKHVEVD